MKNYRFRKMSGDKRHTLTLNEEPLFDANRYLSVIEARGLSPQTIRAYGFDLLYLFRWLDESKKIFSDLTQLDLVDFIRKQKESNSSPRSINRRLVTCSSFYQYCYDRPIASSPGVSYPAPYYKGSARENKLGIFNVTKPSRLKLSVKVPKILIETLTASEVDTILKDVTRYRDLSIFLMMLLCGLRSCEVLSLSENGVDFVNSQLKVLGKGNKERIVPFPKPVSDVTQKYLLFERPDNCKQQQLFVVLQGKRRGQPMTSEGLRNLFRYRRMKSGVKKARPHRWRHTFGTEMARAGVSYKVLQSIMGHADGSQITSQYIHLSMANISDAYKLAIEKIQERYEIGKTII